MPLGTPSYVLHVLHIASDCAAAHAVARCLYGSAFRDWLIAISRRYDWLIQNRGFKACTQSPCWKVSDRPLLGDVCPQLTETGAALFSGISLVFCFSSPALSLSSQIVASNMAQPVQPKKVRHLWKGIGGLTRARFAGTCHRYYRPGRFLPHRAAP